METEERVGVRELYANVSEDLRFAKRQQWTAGYFLILFQAALAGFHQLLASADPELGESPRFLLVGVALAATLVGVWYLADCQRWMRKNRLTLQRIYLNDATEGFLAARGGSEIRTSYWRHGFVLFGLTVAANLGAAAVGWVVLRDLDFALKIFVLALVISLLILLWHRTASRA